MKLKALLTILINKKFFTILTIVSLFINSFIPNFSIEMNEYSMIFETIKQQTTIIQFFTFSSMPIKIISDIISEESGFNVFESSKKTDQKKKKAPNSHNTSSECTLERGIYNLNIKSVKEKNLWNQTFQNIKLFLYFKIIDYGSNTKNIYIYEISHFFFLLPRSSLSDGVTINNLTNISSKNPI